MYCFYFFVNICFFVCIYLSINIHNSALQNKITLWSQIIIKQIKEMNLRIANLTSENKKLKDEVEGLTIKEV
jgi:hypothetical protein